jgi:hypothetical protein
MLGRLRGKFGVRVRVFFHENVEVLHCQSSSAFERLRRTLLRLQLERLAGSFVADDLVAMSVGSLEDFGISVG